MYKIEKIDSIEKNFGDQNLLASSSNWSAFSRRIVTFSCLWIYKLIQKEKSSIKFDCQ